MPAPSPTAYADLSPADIQALDEIAFRVLLGIILVICSAMGAAVLALA